MDIKTYLQESEKTLSDDFHADTKSKRLLHGAIGVSTEANEILDNLKKHVFYGAELDVVNIKEEVGDIMWYISILLRELNLDLGEVMELNIKKLRSRYGEKFDKDKALHRNLDKERKILESKEK